MSPTVFRAKGYRFFFFSREEERPHVDVYHADGEAKFWLEPGVAVAGNFGLSDVRLREATRLLEEHLDEVKDAWRKTSRQVEVTNVSPHGFWMLVGDREVYLPFSLFPWFERASIAEIGNVRLMSPAHLYWPDLDVDISTDSIEHPEKFPLVSRSEMRTKPA